jgi:hypothetical protein
MSPMRPLPWTWLLGIALILAGHATRADQIWNVNLDTSKLFVDYTGPFALDFELVGSSGNTVTISNLAFGVGSPGPGSAFLTGGASGDLSSTVTLTDSTSFFSDFNQQFTPGATLTFTVDTTLIAPPPGGTPDNFSMVMFSAYDPVNGYNPSTGTGGTPLPTTDPTGNNTFFNFNVNVPGQTTVSSYPSSSGDITITVSSVPEPSSLVLACLGTVGSIAGIVWRRLRR